MNVENRRIGAEGESITHLSKELVQALAGLVRSELTLLKEETKITGSRLINHSLKMAMFGSLLAISVLPFLAFLVIGLGDLLNGRYWLSSLVVSFVCAAIGGSLASKAWKDIKENDLELPHTKNSLEREKHVITDKIHNLKDATSRRAV